MKAMKVMKKKAAMKAMKVMKKKAAMKAMKAMKKKSVSKIARGRYAKVMVLRGSKAKTVGGMTSKDLFKNKRGRVVSKKSLHLPRSPHLCMQRQRRSSTSKRCAVTCQDRYGQVEGPAPGVGISTPVERRIHRLLPIAVTDDGRMFSTLYNAT